MAGLKNLSSKEIERVLRSGRRYRGRALLIFVKQADPDQPGRRAFIAPKRLGSAVLRNRCKRLMRAGFNQAQSAGCSSIYDYNDIILMATNGTCQQSSVDISEEIRQVFAKVADDAN